MGLDVKAIDWEDYIPAWEGNRERWMRGEDPEPVRVEIRAQTYGDVRQLSRLLAKRAEVGADDAIDEAYFCQHVRGVSGLTVNGEPVTTGAALWAKRSVLPAELYGELWTAFQDRTKLAAGLRGNWPSPSGSRASA